MKVNDVFLEKTILDIEDSAFNPIQKRSENEVFELWSDPHLVKNLSGNIGAFFVRAILKEIGINEHHIFKWRLENKYSQYQILNYYVPNCMAQTIGFSQLLKEEQGAEKIRDLCKNGFFIKSTLGHRTGITKDFDKTNDLDDILSHHQNNHDDLEKWIVQKRLNLTEEFRIHTFSNDIIYGLTFIMEGKDSAKSLYAEEFVKEIIEKLPNTIVDSTLIGWDIGITDTHEYYVIEANFTGFHPEFHRGFQTSGYFGDFEYGSIACAWLNNYFRNKYNISIGSIENGLLKSDKFYTEFMFYKSIFNDNYIKILNDKTKGITPSAIIYLGDNTNDLMIRLVEYFWQEDFAKKYYLIVGDRYFSIITDLFLENSLFKIMPEEKLFSSEKYFMIQKSDYETRKKACCDKVVRLSEEKSYFIV